MILIRILVTPYINRLYWEFGGKYYCVYVIVIYLRCMLNFLWDYLVT